MIDYKKYPPNWKSEIRPRILKRANYSCESEGCQFAHGQLVFRALFKGKRIWYSSYEEAVKHHGIHADNKPIQVILTIAHLDHDEENWNVTDDRLKAFCQLHHLKYDAQEHERRKKLPKKEIIKSSEKLILEGEEWSDIKGYEGIYQVSSFGRIKSLSRLKDTGLVKSISENKILKPGIHPEGYHLYKLYHLGFEKTIRVHRIVAKSFIPNPLNLPIVNHKDLNPGNNHKDNLEWCTPKHNTRHAINNGVKWSPNPSKGSNRYNAKLTEKIVSKIRRSILPYHELAIKYGVSQSTIGVVKSKKAWKHVQ